MSGIDAEQARNVIQAQFPTVRPGRVQWLGEGYDSTAFDVDNVWVFRFPKRRDVERQLLMEMRLLPLLASDSPLPVPLYRFNGMPSRLFPRHFGGYRKLAGVPAIGLDADPVRDRLAPKLASFLSHLHAFPLGHAADQGIPRLGRDSAIVEARTEALEDIGTVARVAPDLIADAWIEALAEAPASGNEPYVSDNLVHGDLAAEHFMYDSATASLCGVIDWSDVAIGDPAVDLAGVFHWGGARLLDAVLSSYRGAVDDATLARARYLAACRGIADVRFGIETDRAEYVAAGVRALDFSAAR
ncbi:MAG TPA: phosphotransferase [Longimicrobiales bacterium]|nr:phosphotransferase [Longimicrobiales bacterium]